MTHPCSHLVQAPVGISSEVTARLVLLQGGWKGEDKERQSVPDGRIQYTKTGSRMVDATVMQVDGDYKGK